MLNIRMVVGIVVLVSSGVFSQETEMHCGVKVIKNATEYAFNLKDSVKSARFFYSYVKEGLGKDERGRVIIRNFNRQPFYVEFDPYGMLKKQILFSGKADFADAPVDSSKAEFYEFDNNNKDRTSKYNFKIKKEQVYPVYIEDKIDINYTVKITHPDVFIFKHIYSYIYNDKGSIIKDFSYTISDDKTGEITDKDLHILKVYEYDDKDRLIKQSLFAGQYGRELGNFTKMSSTIGLCDDAHLSYKYDDRDRVIETSLNCGTTVVQKDEYIYHPDKNFVATIKRFMIDPSMGGYYRQNTILYYNEQGDMIEINHINNPRESWDKQPEYTTTWDGGPLTMKYDYEYDRHNNWIKCRMYLEENKDEPTIMAERVIEYYGKE
ncbi:hypothetical protein ACI6PS_14120 [Flavobacterium sp. PLA-1-15]|uniref:hypothetical protein n=1 Tax=Flavobacterium sp. PLA-1-15 TaxID=3380533 RepID=UPI003B7E3DF5